MQSFNHALCPAPAPPSQAALPASHPLSISNQSTAACISAQGIKPGPGRPHNTTNESMVPHEDPGLTFPSLPRGMATGFLLNYAALSKRGSHCNRLTMMFCRDWTGWLLYLCAEKPARPSQMSIQMRASEAYQLEFQAKFSKQNDQGHNICCIRHPESQLHRIKISSAGFCRGAQHVTAIQGISVKIFSKPALVWAA